MSTHETGKFNRFSGPAMQTASVTLRNTAGRMVHMVGVSHIAAPRFWKDLNRIISMYDMHGWLIHYERVKPLTKQQFDSLTSDEREIHNALKSVLESNYGFGKSSALAFQGDALKLPPAAVNTDIDMLALIRSLAESKDAPIMKEVMGLVSKLPKVVRKTAALLASLPAFESGDSHITKVLKDDRNDIALAEFDKSFGNVLMLWGSAHLSGLYRGLLNRGFTEIDRQWHTVFTVGELYSR